MGPEVDDVPLLKFNDNIWHSVMDNNEIYKYELANHWFPLTQLTTISINTYLTWVEAVAQWIHLRLPSAAPGSNPKHTIYAFINLNCDTLKRRK